MEYRVPLGEKDQQNTLRSHFLVPVALNGRGPFTFAVEPSRSRTLVAANTLENLGLNVDALPATLALSDEVAFPLLRLQSIAVGGAVLNDFEVVVWGRPVIPQEMLAGLEADRLYHLRADTDLDLRTPISSILECRGVLGSDFLRHFRVVFDFAAESFILAR